ncbi:hypothetical protein [Pseudomonas marincola]|nr:hypothetical protein [Pseudomonas marincola]
MQLISLSDYAMQQTAHHRFAQERRIEQDNERMEQAAQAHNENAPI